MAKAAAKTEVSPIVLIAIEQYFPEKQRIIEDIGISYIAIQRKSVSMTDATQLGQKLSDPCARERFSRHLGWFGVQKAVYRRETNEKLIRRETNRFEQSDWSGSESGCRI